MDDFDFGRRRRSTDDFDFGRRGSEYWDQPSASADNLVVSQRIFPGDACEIIAGEVRWLGQWLIRLRYAIEDLGHEQFELNGRSFHGYAPGGTFAGGDAFRGERYLPYSVALYRCPKRVFEEIKNTENNTQFTILLRSIYDKVGRDFLKRADSNRLDTVLKMLLVKLAVRADMVGQASTAIVYHYLRQALDVAFNLNTQEGVLRLKLLVNVCDPNHPELEWHEVKMLTGDTNPMIKFGDIRQSMEYLLLELSTSKEEVEDLTVAWFCNNYDIDPQQSRRVIWNIIWQKTARWLEDDVYYAIESAKHEMHEEYQDRVGDLHARMDYLGEASERALDDTREEWHDEVAQLKARINALELDLNEVRHENMTLKRENNGLRRRLPADGDAAPSDDNASLFGSINEDVSSAEGMNM